MSANARPPSVGTTAEDDAAPRLLMVEDDPYDAELTLHHLRRHGLRFAEVAVVASEADYLARLDDFRPDLVIADYRVPGLTGGRSLALAHARHPDVPFIIVSGTVGEEVAVDLLTRGAWDYVLKDRPSRLGAAVRRSLDEARLRREAEADRQLALRQLEEGREQLRGLVNSLPDPCVLVNAVRDGLGTIVDFRVVHAGDATYRYLGCRPHQLLGRTMSELLPDFVSPSALAPYAAAVETGVPFSETDLGYRHLLPDGLLRRYDVYAAKVDDGLSISWRDVTDRHAAQEALRLTARELRASEERFRLAFEEALVGMALVDVTAPRGRFLRVNRALTEFLGRPEPDLIALAVADVVAPEDRPRLKGAIHDLLAGTSAGYRAEHRFLAEPAVVRCGLTSVVLVQQDPQDQCYALVAVEDITARKDAEETLAFRALHDDLTGLPNRALLLDHLRSALARAHRDGTLVGVLFVDLDDFKSVNDSFGHLVGDGFLVQVSERIAGCLRDTDTAARIGGDEFVVVCESLPDPAAAGSVAHRVESALAAGIQVAGRRIGAPASIGIAISTERSTAETLLRDADTAMYAAKRAGGRRSEPADGLLHEAAVRMLSLEGQLLDAVREGQLRLEYQPTYDLRTERLVAVEALLRWDHPTRGVVLPEDFIDVAERRNLIGPIGDWVLATACGQAADWNRRFGGNAPLVAVNVSSRQLGGSRLPARLAELLERTGLAPDRLCLEITETQFVSAGTSAAAELRLLAAAGTSLAVDDFGTGYAGFEYLRRLPVDTIKIDRSYVRGLGTDDTDTAIVASIVTLGQRLGLTVIAEGIETPDQFRQLRDLGCGWGQGWLWHPALPPAEVEQYF